MANLNDIAQIAEALEESPIYIVGDRCVAVRNRNASCRECVSACPFDVISVAKNEISFETAKCVGCGACATVCPTEALVPVAPSDEVLANAVADAVAAADGAAVFTCARMAAKHIANPDMFAEVPCLARIDEVLLVQIAARGVTDITLVDGTCSTCKYGKTSDYIEATVACANELLGMVGSAAQVTRTSAFPDQLVVDGADSMYGSTRRGFFSDAANAAKSTTMKAVKATAEQQLHLKKQKAKIGERLRVSKGGSLPQLRPVRHESALNALDSIGQPVVDTVYTRLFASVDIDVDVCNSCGMCAVFCPTGAIKRDECEKMSDPIKYLEFSACDCVQCGMCMDVCWKRCLTLNDMVSTDELFDFEPRTFVLHEQKKKSPFGK